jgi:hypothetical protein
MLTETFACILAFILVVKTFSSFAPGLYACFSLFLHFFFPLDVLQPQHVGYGLIEFNGLGKVHCMAGALKGEHAQGAQYACTLHDLAAQADVERVSLVVSWLFGDSSVCV